MKKSASQQLNEDNSPLAQSGADSLTLQALEYFLLHDSSTNNLPFESLNPRERLLYNETQNFFLLTENTYSAMSQHFSPDQIKRINSSASGPKNVEKALLYLSDMDKLGYSREQFMEIARHNGGFSNIQTVIANHAQLIKLNFTRAQIVKIAAFHGGGKNIQYVIKYQEVMSFIGNENACRIAARHGASLTIEKLNNSYQQLKNQNLSDEEIKKKLIQPPNLRVNNSASFFTFNATNQSTLELLNKTPSERTDLNNLFEFH